MTQQYYSILTNIGLAKEAAANSPGGSPVSLTHIAVGDGDGSVYNPVSTQTELVNEVYRTTLTHVAIDASNSNQLIVEGVLNEEIGSFHVREVGIFDSEGDLFAIGKYPETYKPTLASGSGKRLYIRMILGFANAPQVELILSEDLNNDPNFNANVINELADINDSLASINDALSEKLAKAENLADVEDAEEARENLGLKIGVNVQAFAANLAAFAALIGAANKVPYFTGAGQLGLIDLSSNKNVIINGNLDIWQRGITATISGSPASAFVADRWEFASHGSHSITYSQDTDVPSFAQAGSLFKYSIKLLAGTGNASPAANNYGFLRQRIEGYNYQDLAQKVKTFSFWIKASKTGILCVAFNNSGQNRSFIKEITIDAVNTWEKKVINVVAEDGAGTWDYLNGIGLSVDFCFLAGSNFEGTKDAWVNQTSKFVTTSRTNFFSATNDTVRIFGFRLEPGLVATPIEHRLIQQEMFLCQRYLEYYAITTVPAALFCYQSYPWKVQKRATPTLSVAAGSLNGGSVDVAGGAVSSDPRAGLAGFRQQSAAAGATDVLIKGECEL